MIPKVDLHSESELIETVQALLPISNDNSSYKLAFGLPPELSPYGARFGVKQISSSPLSYHEAKNHARKIYDIFYRVLNHDDSKIIICARLSEEEKRQIRNVLRTEGYRVSERNFIDFSRIAEAVRNEKYIAFEENPSGNFRHASLNCFDYDRLKSEVADLLTLLPSLSLEYDCKVLYRILKEADENKNYETTEQNYNPAYPGRHLSTFDIKCRKTSQLWSYRILRIIDEILCTSDYALNAEEMKMEIISRARQLYGSRFNADKISLSANSLRHFYGILDSLLSVEYYSGDKPEGARTGFIAEPVRGKRRYADYKEGQRLCAFAVDISLTEAKRLRSEIGLLRANNNFGPNGEFDSRFPLLSILGRMHDEALTNLSEEKIFNEIARTDLLTINYVPMERKDLKKIARKAIKDEAILKIISGDSERFFFPIQIREQAKKWSIIGREIHREDRTISENLTVLPPSDSMSFEIISTPIPNIEDFSSKVDQIVGISELIEAKPVKIILKVTAEGKETIENKKVLKTITTHYIGPAKKSGEPQFSFRAYINNDLLADLVKLDKNAKLISIEPEDFLEKYYVPFYESTMGIKYLPLSKRENSNKGRTKRKITKKHIFE